MTHIIIRWENLCKPNHCGQQISIQGLQTNIGRGSEVNYLTIYKARRYIYLFIYLYHFTDTTASTLTRVSAKTVKDIKLKPF